MAQLRTYNVTLKPYGKNRRVKADDLRTKTYQLHTETLADLKLQVLTLVQDDFRMDAHVHIALAGRKWRKMNGMDSFVRTLEWIPYVPRADVAA